MRVEIIKHQFNSFKSNIEFKNLNTAFLFCGFCPPKWCKYYSMALCIAYLPVR